MHVKVALSDIDGTLIDRNDFYVLAWEAFLGEGSTIDRQAIQDQIGRGADNLVPTLLPRAAETMREPLGETHGDIFKRKYLETAKPFPDARALLQRVHGRAAGVVGGAGAVPSRRRVVTHLEL